MKKIITLFGSSRPKPGTPDYRLARRVGFALACSGFTLCNGGYGGTMEASAKGAKEAGGKTIGITFAKQGLHANRYIDRTERKTTLLGRLERLVQIADGYLVFKGGTGTLLEVALILEMTHKKFSPPKPMVFMGNFWRKTVETARLESKAGSSYPFASDPGGMERYVRFVETPQEAVKLFKELLR